MIGGGGEKELGDGCVGFQRRSCQSWTKQSIKKQSESENALLKQIDFLFAYRILIEAKHHHHHHHSPGSFKKKKVFHEKE